MWEASPHQCLSNCYVNKVSPEKVWYFLSLCNTSLHMFKGDNSAIIIQVRIQLDSVWVTQKETQLLEAPPKDEILFYHCLERLLFLTRYFVLPDTWEKCVTGWTNYIHTRSRVSLYYLDILPLSGSKFYTNWLEFLKLEMRFVQKLDSW